MFIMLTNAGKETDNSRSVPSGTSAPSDNMVDLLETLQTSLMEDMCVEGFDLSLFDNYNPILDCNSELDCNPILDLGKYICNIKREYFCTQYSNFYLLCRYRL
jgi:hypothetical protein